MNLKFDYLIVSEMEYLEYFHKRIISNSNLFIVSLQVKISPDFKSLFVLWIAKENDQDEDIQEQLDGIASPLRHELSQLRLVGNVPKIFFVKGK